MTDHDLRPPQQRKQRTPSTSKWLVMGVVLAALAAAAWYFKDHWLTQVPGAVSLPSVATTAPSASEPASPEPEQVVQSAPEPAVEVPAHEGPLYPVPQMPAQAQSPAAEVSLDQLAVQWLGQSAWKFLVTPGLAHHVVATIDNLPRSHAAPRLWPLSPVGGKMVLLHEGDGLQIARANSHRYDAVVDFVIGIAPAQAALWYQQAYPLLQTAYEDLGYPKQYFNDRLIEVIDHLLLTPEPVEPIAVNLVQVQGQIAPQQPWLRYEYADPQLESLSAGQKILLRLGAEHRQRLRAYLQELRAQIAIAREVDTKKPA